MNKIDELEMKLKQLSEEIEWLKTEKENETGKFEHGDVYWFINHIGEIKLAIWYGDPEDKTRLKVEAELRRFARPFHVGEDNYTLYFSNYLNSICMVCYSDVQYGNIYFASKEIAQKAIDTVGEERIKKYYFGIIE